VPDQSGQMWATGEKLVFGPRNAPRRQNPKNCNFFPTRQEIDGFVDGLAFSGLGALDRGAFCLSDDGACLMCSEANFQVIKPLMASSPSAPDRPDENQRT
jgi:hypothetical protein